MKLSKNLLKQLILEVLEEEDIYGKESGKLIATDVPKKKYITFDDEFLTALKPIVSLSQERLADEEGISLRDLLYFIYQRLDVKNTKKLAADFNAEFQNIGAKFSEDTMNDILDILKAEKRINNTGDIIGRLNFLKADQKSGKYMPDKDFEPPFKTANYKGQIKKPEVDLDKTEPDFTPPELKEKKVRVKYKCN